MRAILYLILLSAVAFASGCATPYQSSGFRGGFSETRLAPDVFRVSFRGNAYTSRERTQDFALLRAAEFTLEHGYAYLSVVDAVETETIAPILVAPGRARTTGNAHISGTGRRYGRNTTFSGQANYSETTTYTPPTTLTVAKPASGLLIRCYHEKPEGISVLDAKFLLESLRAKYKIATDSLAIKTLPKGFVLDDPERAAELSAVKQ